ncbi:MAG: tetratricopeptide repeat protein [Bacteroidota bacterium]|nr:tetratricopeptide repeat protein [Bacteroidota bacterium]
MARRWAIALLLSVLAVGHFHCASPEFTTAKIALGQRDYPKALRNLEAETQKNPSNIEAWLLLAQLHREHTRSYEAAAQALQGARANDKTGRWTTQIAAEEVALWVTVYNQAIVQYNEVATAQSPSAEQLQKTRQLLQLAIRLKPDVPDPYGLLGIVEELARDTVAALQNFVRYRQLVQPEIEAAQRAGVTLGMARSELLRRLGPPAQSRNILAEQDTLFVDLWTVEGQPLYVFAAAVDGKEAVVEGWRYRPPQAWTQAEKERYARLMVQPLVNAALAYMDRGVLDTALSYARDVLTLSPESEAGMGLLLEIYDRQGRTQELLDLLQRLRSQFPTKTAYTLQYAIVLTKQERYQEATKAYDEVLQREPANELALFNGAVAYKNWAGKLQQEEIEKRRQNPRYQEQRERYAPLLRRSAELFERYRQLPGKQDEFLVLEQLLNIYEVLGETQKLTRLVAELERLEPLYATQPRYYELLGGYYARRGEKAKAEQYYNRADRLRNQQ